MLINSNLFGNASDKLTVTNMEPHPQSEKACILTFSNGKRAMCGKKHFSFDANGNPIPNFLANENGLVKDNYAINMIDGTPWLVNSSNKGQGLKLS